MNIITEDGTEINDFTGDIWCGWGNFMCMFEGEIIGGYDPRTPKQPDISQAEHEARLSKEVWLSHFRTGFIVQRENPCDDLHDVICHDGLPDMGDTYSDKFKDVKVITMTVHPVGICMWEVWVEYDYYNGWSPTRIDGS